MGVTTCKSIYHINDPVRFKLFKYIASKMKQNTMHNIKCNELTKQNPSCCSYFKHLLETRDLSSIFGLNGLSQCLIIVLFSCRMYRNKMCSLFIRVLGEVVKIEFCSRLMLIIKNNSQVFKIFKYFQY